MSLVLYRNWRYEQELDSLLWKVDYKEIQLHENDKEGNSQKHTRVSRMYEWFRTICFSVQISRKFDFDQSHVIIREVHYSCIAHCQRNGSNETALSLCLNGSGEMRIFLIESPYTCSKRHHNKAQLVVQVVICRIIFEIHKGI